MMIEDKKESHFKENIEDQGQNFLSYIEKAIKLFKKEPALFILFTFIHFSIIWMFFSMNESNNNLVSFIYILITPSINAGYYLVANKIYHDEKVELKTFFEGFDYFMPLAIVGIITAIIVLIGFVFFIVPGIYFSMVLSFAPLFVIFYKLDSISAIKNSFKVFNKNLINFLFFFLMLIAINIGGILLFGFGLLITVPISHIAIYFAFRDIIIVEEHKHVIN